MESSPPKRQREQELTEPRSLDTTQPGNQGVGMELNQEANVQGEVGYETVTFDNNTSTRIPGTLAKGLAGAHFGEKDQMKLKNETVG